MVEDFLKALADVFDNDPMVMSIFAVALCLSAIGFIAFTIRQGRTDVARRIAPDADASAPASKVPAGKAGKMGGLVAQLADSIDEPNAKDRKVLRHRLVQAGLMDNKAVSWFVGLRLVCMPIFAGLGYLAASWMWPDSSDGFMAAFSIGSAAIGYIVPSSALDRRIKKLQEEHRDGFPDFMDLMVVCCQAGLSMEAAISRVARELAVAYPSLARNLELGVMELRGGKSLSKAVDSLSKRLGIPEATSFSTLLQQSEELGSSLTQSLRAYSDDMRNKRLMLAEEKAHALPAKLVIPLTLFVFPVLMVVIMLPVVIGVSDMKV
jgi:tight adherence protein C